MPFDLHIPENSLEGRALQRIADQQHVTPQQVLERIVNESLRSAATSHNREVDSESRAAIDQLNAWTMEDATDDPEVMRVAEEDLAEFKRGMNANRAATGDHPVYP